MNSRGLCLGIVLAGLLIPSSAVLSATVEATGYIVNDTTWTGTDTVIVSGFLIVADTVKLTVEAGARVLFTSGAKLMVQGEVEAEGSSTQRILFTSSADTTGGTPVAGAWAGISFEMTGRGSLRHCDFKYATNSVSALESSPTIERCVMEHFSVAGCYIDGYDAYPRTTPRVENCIIMQTDPALIGTGNGIVIYRATNVTITGCWIRNCRDGLNVNAVGSLTPHFAVTNTDIGDNARYGIYTYAGG
ncbi:MAG TPA: right-handed parallel beta-helix repeat-containing protein [Acidobacteriota bacterium]|nr:right-handed parallel beta-helix repeat-containing protein [Acidobacteriota bacterium]